MIDIASKRSIFGELDKPNEEDEGQVSSIAAVSTPVRLDNIEIFTTAALVKNLKVQSEKLTNANSPRSDRSDEYVIVNRRRRAQRISQELAAMQGSNGLGQLAVLSSIALDSISETIEYLSGAKLEGYSREILRCVRDCLVDGGYARFVNPADNRLLRKAVARLSAEVVGSQEITVTHQELDGLVIRHFPLPPEDSDGNDLD